MVLENLSNALKNTLQKIAKSLFVDEKLINELVNFLGKEQQKIEVNKKPFKIMLVGLFGSGKTTTAGKLAKYFSKRGFKVVLVGLDVHRPAAMEQIEQVGKQANVKVFSDRKTKDAVEIWENVKNELNDFDVLIVDTSGRDALSHDLIAEIEEVNKRIKPDENLLVISADIGQAAQKQAGQFHKSCGITGIVVSKMDGTAKGGGALTACAVSGAPIKFIGVGEKIDDLEHFNPKGFVGRLLGMGDLEALLEKAKDVIKAEDAEDLGKRLLQGEFNLLDLYEQMAAMKKMGSLQKIVEMIPGFSSLQLPKEMLDVQEEKLENWKIAMSSMTREELEDPEIITSERIDRISKGSGIPTSIIRELLKQYHQSKKIVKMFKGSKGDMSKMMKKFQGKFPAGFKI